MVGPDVPKPEREYDEDQVKGFLYHLGRTSEGNSYTLENFIHVLDTITIEDINVQLSEISNLNIINPSTVDPEVKDRLSKAWRRLDEILTNDDPSGYLEMVREYKGIFLIYGSMQYCDPIKLDADIEVLFTEELSKEEKNQIYQLKSKFHRTIIANWEDIKILEQGEPHITHSYFADLDGLTNEILLNADGENPLFYKGIDILKNLEVLLTATCTGITTMEQIERLEKVRKEIMQYLTENSLARAVIYLELKDLIEDRQKRR